MTEQAPERVTMTLPDGPALIVSDGYTVRTMADSEFDRWSPGNISRLDRDLLVTRLRCWADKIEHFDSVEHP